MGIISTAVKHLVKRGGTPEEILELIQELEAEFEQPEQDQIGTPPESTKKPQEKQLVRPGNVRYIVNSISSNNNNTITRKRVSATDLDFNRFWAVYPRRQAKGGARKAFDRALKRATADEIIAGAKRYADSKPEKQYTCLPTTWLNQDRWLDEDSKDAPKTLAPNIYAWETEKANYIDKHGVKAWYNHIAERRKARENNALVRGDDEGQEGRASPKEPKMARLSDFLPPLPAMDQPQENQAALFAQAVPDEVSVCWDDPPDPFDVPN